MCESLMLDFDNQHLKNFYVSSSQPMLIVDKDAGLILEMNDSAVKLAGYNLAEYFPQPVETVLRSRKNLLSVIDTGLSTQINLKKEFTLVNQNGKLGFVEADITTILYQEKEAMLYSLTDITDKKLYRAMLEDAIEEEISLKTQNQKLKKIAYLNLHLARKPLANILGLVNVIDQTKAVDQTLLKAITFLKESGQELNEVIKSIDPQSY